MISCIHLQSLNQLITSGELILTAGVEPTDVYIVMYGVVSNMDPTGHVILDHLSQGNSFGEVETSIDVI